MAGKAQLARDLGIARSSLYYTHLQPHKDWQTKQQIEQVLRSHPSYGHKRIALHLGCNKKKILRVMKIYGIKPYHRRGKKYRKPKKKEAFCFSNLLLNIEPQHPDHIWVSDFTHISYKGKWMYLATIMDLYTRRIVGTNVLANHSKWLVMNALAHAVHDHPRPAILHSDQGSEYTSKDYTTLCTELGIQQSMSAPGCPWENGYQESFYNQFKIDIGDPSRFESLGQLVYHLYRAIYHYNNERIHSALKMAPNTFYQQTLAPNKLP